MAIRTLLSEPGKQLGRMASVPDTTPTDAATPESYLGAERLARFASPGGVVPNVRTVYRFPSSLPQNDLAYAGEWTVGPQKVVAGRAARLRLHFHARHVYLVLGGTGDLGVLVDGKPVKAVHVRGFSRLYTLLSYPRTRDAVLELRFTPGLEGYAFTFG
jgi:hypothetical protein